MRGVELTTRTKTRSPLSHGVVLTAIGSFPFSETIEVAQSNGAGPGGQALTAAISAGRSVLPSCIGTAGRRRMSGVGCNSNGTGTARSQHRSCALGES